MAKASSYLCRNKHGVLYFRIGIPKDLRPYFSDRWEYKQSLRCRDEQKASMVAHFYSMKLRYIFQKLRERDMKNSLPIFGFKTGKITVKKDSYEIDGMEFDPDKPLEEEQAAAKHLFEQLDKRIGRTERDQSMKLSTLAESFCDNKMKSGKWGQPTLTAYKADFERFIFIVGDLPLSKLDFPVLEYFRDTLPQFPKSFKKKARYKDARSVEAVLLLSKGDERIDPETASQSMTRVSTLLGFAEHRKYIDTNYAKGLSATGQKAGAQDKVDPYVMDELNAIFSHDRYTGNGKITIAEYWIPLIALFQGMRLEEVGRLRVDDIKHDSKFWIIDLWDRLHLKNNAAVRKIPLHQTLLDLNFLDFVKHMKAKGHHRLFPELKPDPTEDGWNKELNPSNKRVTNKFSDKYRTLTQKIGIWKVRKKVFNSFRHTFMYQLKIQLTDDKLVDALVGHSDQNLSTGLYGWRYPAHVLDPIVQSLDYENAGLKLNIRPWTEAIIEINKNDQ